MSWRAVLRMICKLFSSYEQHFPCTTLWEPIPGPLPAGCQGPSPASSLPWRAGYTQAVQHSLLEACFRAHALHRVTDEAHLPSFHGRVTCIILISANGSFLHKFYRAGRWEASHFHSSRVFLHRLHSSSLELASVCYRVPCT